MKDKSVLLKLTPEVKAQIQAIAKQEKRSMQSQLEVFIEAAIKDYQLNS